MTAEAPTTSRRTADTRRGLAPGLHAPAPPANPAPDPADEVIFRAPAWDWSQAGSIGWWTLPSWTATLLDAGRLRLDEWRDAGRLVEVKAGPHRVVYRADLPAGSIYIKHNLVPDLRAVLRQWFRRGKGRNEARRARQLGAIGVPTITPIALGEQRKRGFLFENYLVTTAIVDAVSLDEFVERRLPEMPPAVAASVRCELARTLAVLTARLHEAGFVHIDFHPGNILIREGGDGLELSMIDTDALRVARKPVGWAESRDNLALLDHYFFLRCGRVDRQRFLASYLSARASSPPDPREFAASIERATRAWAERLWRRWGRRCRKTNKYFEATRGATGWAVASRSMGRDEVARLLDDPDAPLARPDTAILKRSRTTTVAEVTLVVDGMPTRVIYKRFNAKKWLEPLLNCVRPSRGWRAWQGGQHLASRGVPTPQSLAFLARTGRRRLAAPRETYLITRKVEPSLTLGDYAREVLPTLDPRARRGRIVAYAAALARLLRTLHERSLSHRDLKAANILIEGDPAAPEPRLTLIDLVGVALDHPLPASRRLQNLARIHLSLADTPGRTRGDSLRFLRAYMPPGPARRSAWRDLWRGVEAEAEAKVGRNARSGRPLS